MYKRSDRVSKLIKIEISNMLLFGELKDPRIQGAKITNVDVANDLSKAKVYFSIEEGMSSDDAITGFRNAKGFIRRRLGEVLYMKKIPNIFFIYDHSVEDLNKIEEIIKKIYNE
jgi:ribosome-binding factor A